MPRKLEKALTPLKIKNAKAGMHADGGNLYLAVTPAANGGLNKSWIFRFGVPGPDGRTRYRDFGLGSLSTFGLAQARERARLLREKRYDGVDPIEERRAARAVVPVRVVTFGEAADQWFDARSTEWKPTYQRAQRARLRDYVTPVVGKLAVRDVKVEHVTDILGSLWQSHPNTGALVRMQLEAVLDYAKVSGWRDGENPARWAGHLKFLFGKTAKLRKAKREAEGRAAHHEALPWREVSAFMGELRALPEDVAALALEFTILTAARTGETVGATWGEVDLAKRTWTIPARRMGKGKKEHRVPLSGAAVAVLERMAAIRVDDRIFPHLVLGAMLRLLNGRLKREALTVHGFRSSFRDWAAEETSFPRELAEVALSHAVGSETEQAYQRGDLFEKRRKLMDAWAAYCARPAAGGKVLPMKKKAAR